MDEYELNDWLSDEYGFTQHGWEPIEENRMRITKRQLRKIIKEEKAKLTEQMTLGSRARGLMQNDMAERTKTLMTHLYNNSVNDFIAEEGLMAEEAEEMAVAGVVEVVKEFLDSVGYRHYLKQ
jgi:DNA repair protein RadC